MNRGAIQYFAMVLAFCIPGASVAHHPPLMERCESFTFSGQVEQVEWRNPHVELAIRAEDGVTHRVIWLNIQQLSLAGIDRNTLHDGDQVTVTVGTRRDVIDRPMLLAAITRPGDGWNWSQVPQGC